MPLPLPGRIWSGSGSGSSSGPIDVGPVVTGGQGAKGPLGGAGQTVQETIDGVEDTANGILGGLP